MRRDEGQPLDAGQFDEPAAEIAEVLARRGILPSVDRLTDEHDLTRALRDATAALLDDIGRRPVIEAAAHVRNDAERAIIRAAALHRHLRAQMRVRAGDAVGGTAERRE